MKKGTKRRIAVPLLLAVCTALSCAGCSPRSRTRIIPQSTEPISAERQTQFLQPDAARTTESETQSRQDDGWKEAYRQYLYWYMDDRDLADSFSYGVFALAFIDNDDIPELVVAESTSHAFDAKVLSFGENGLVEHGDFGTFGQIRYLEKKNLIVSDVVYQGCGSLRIHKLTKTGAKEVWSATHAQVWNDDLRECVEEFEIYDRPVSTQEYYAAYQQFVPDESELKSSADDDDPYVFVLTAENIEKIPQITF